MGHSPNRSTPRGQKGRANIYVKLGHLRCNPKPNNRREHNMHQKVPQRHKSCGPAGKGLRARGRKAFAAASIWDARVPGFVERHERRGT